MIKKATVGVHLFSGILLGIFSYLYIDGKKIGSEIDTYRGVPVYYNGVLYTQSHGRSYSDSGYFYGWKWQCIEYVRRFYSVAKGHEMPDIYGNAKYYFDSTISQGGLNASRNLIQYRNGGNEKPQPDDLLVFADKKYGHVAIVTEVTDDSIEVIQQNVYGKTRVRYPIAYVNGNWTVGKSRKPLGWLRLY